jgi:hypothetical protein
MTVGDRGAPVPAIVISDLGEIHLLTRSLRGADSPASVWHLRLFKNNYTPNRDTVLADLTEADFAGYVPLEIDPTVWGVPTNPAGTAVSYYDTFFYQFTCTSGSQALYGYYLTFNNGAYLLWSQAFDVGQTASPTTPPTVWPVITGRSQYQPAPP